MGKKLIVVTIALTAANFIYQIMTGNHAWDDASERSFAQGVAMVVAYLNLKA